MVLTEWIGTSHWWLEDVAGAKSVYPAECAEVAWLEEFTMCRDSANVNLHQQNLNEFNMFDQFNVYVTEHRNLWDLHVYLKVHMNFYGSHGLSILVKLLPASDDRWFRWTRFRFGASCRPEPRPNAQWILGFPQLSRPVFFGDSWIIVKLEIPTFQLSNQFIEIPSGIPSWS